MQTRTKALLAASGVAIAALSGIGGFTMAQASQPHMVNALSDLQAAQTELNAALPDKGGHRVVALRLVGQAITQVQAGVGVAAGA
ncbi:MAG TPA: hypothetical protein VHW60_13220 [Caulobacteraceae bacterium]|jgi:hypothetical protein|nr:hypothetical protein [Caulobacteraceae bacterium]